MSKVARGGGTNHRRADNKETHSNWIMVAAGYFKTGVSGLSGLSLVRALGAAIS